MKLVLINLLLIGLELEGETYQGELSDIKDALLPIFGAVGGMLTHFKTAPTTTPFPSAPAPPQSFASALAPPICRSSSDG
jgi:hypothetical protein